MAFKNIIFDIDGTILDSYHTYMDATKKAIKEVLNYQLNSIEEDEFFHFTNTQMFEALGISADGLEAKRINELSDKYISEAHVELFDGAKEVIKHFKERGYFLAINTSRTGQEAREQECLVDILKYFNYVVTSDLVTFPKPDKESTNLILDTNSLLKEETIMIGDSVNDALTSNSAGIKFALAGWGARDQSVACDYYLDNFNDIYRLIEKGE